MLQADPYQLRWLASRFSAAADEIRSKATAIELISSDVTGGTSGWKGDAAQGFVQKAESLTHEVREAVRDFAAIIEALQTLAHRVEQIQMKQQHLQNLQQERSHLHFGLDLSVDAEIARLDGHIWALEAEITADRMYADMAATTSFRVVQFREMFPDFFDFAEGVAASVVDNITGSDLLEPAFPEDRSNWYKAGRVAGDVASAVTGAEEMLLGLGAVGAGDAEAILTSPTVALPLIGVGVAAVGAGAVAQGYKTFDNATKRLSDDVSLFKKEGSSSGGSSQESSKPEFDVESFEKSIAKMNVNERVATIRTTAAEIAKRNNWKKDTRLTKLNGRDVYFDAESGKYYYAVDTQHGRFEVINKKGKHQGEVDFNLNPTKAADPSGGHDLKVK